MIRPAVKTYADRVSSESPWQRYWHNATLRDASLAVIMTVVLLFGAYGEAHPDHHYHVPKEPNVALLLVAAATLVLAVRRRYPLTVLAVSTAAVVTYTLFGYENGAALLAPTLALYTVAIVTT